MAAMDGGVVRTAATNDGVDRMAATTVGLGWVMGDKTVATDDGGRAAAATHRIAVTAKVW